MSWIDTCAVLGVSARFLLILSFARWDDVTMVNHSLRSWPVLALAGWLLTRHREKLGSVRPAHRDDQSHETPGRQDAIDLSYKKDRERHKRTRTGNTTHKNTKTRNSHKSVV